MKKFVSILLTAVLLCSMFSVMTLTASAESGLCGSDGEVHWELIDDTLRIYGHGNMENYSSWRKTPWYPYDAYEKVKHIIVEDGITRIGDYAFAYFYYVEDITLGKDLFTIGKCAFYQATYYSGEYVFRGDTGKPYRRLYPDGRDVYLVIPSSVYEIGEYAFSEAMHLKAVSIRWDFTTAPQYIRDWGIYGRHIGKYAFSECAKLTTLTIGNLEKTSGEDDWNIWLEPYAFYYCQKLDTVYLADTVSSVYEGAFYDCAALKNIHYFGVPEKYSRIDIGRYNEPFAAAAKNIQYRDIKDAPLKHDQHNHWKEIDNNPFLTQAIPHELVCVIEDQYAVDGDPFSYRKHCDVCGAISGETFSVLDIPTVPRLTADTTTLSNGIYIVDSQINLGGTRLEVKGDAKLLLRDGCGITTSGGIGIKKNAKLTVYSESIDTSGQGQMGYIKVTGAPENCAGIGGNERENGGEFILRGGNIEVHGGSNAAGIGSGHEGTATVSIYDGYVRAWGGRLGAGIGSGFASSDNGTDAHVEIHGGYVEAYGGQDAAGIGSGYSQPLTWLERYMARCSVDIYGGTIKAYGNSACGIGCGGGGSICYVHIEDDADVTAVGSGLYPDVGSTLSEGNIWIVVAVAVVVVAGIVTLIIVKKKKKKSAAEDNAEKDEE